MKKTIFKISLAVICQFLLIFCSCLGVGVDISLNQNGSGTVLLEYQISKAFDALGKLDGNERWNSIPAGKADFERTMDRLSGLKLTSFSSKENKNDLLINAKMEFENLNSLMAFLDAGGLRSSFSGDSRSGSISLILNEAGNKINPVLDKLISEISEPYSVKLSMSFPKEGNVKIINGIGLPVSEIPGSVINSYGKKVSCTFPLYSVLCAAEGINVEFSW